jgi:hypothetical protein
MNCAWITNQRGQSCIYGCGTTLKRDYDERPFCVCKGATQEQPVRLGDAVESVLAGIGITPDRYAAAKEFFGLPPNCGCAARKEWLNKVSDWWNKEKT